ncbi:MAG TPA: hypothetical protein VHW23_30415 [Kofleriaceae bacterium]|nr:hypothetical protein [Kofleriaceae bacterium]
MRRFAIALSACLWACGDNQPGPGDVPPDTGFHPAPHAALPTVFPHTGTVLSSMQLVTLTYAGYDAGSGVLAFGDALVASSWYHTTGAEYGVRPASHRQQYVIGAPPAMLDRAMIATQIIGLITGGAVAGPEVNDNQVLYLLYVPHTVALGGDLAGMHGYHEMLTLEGVRFPIAVVIDDGTGLAATTTQAAHQVIDAATNPYLPPNDGYYADPPQTDPWSLVRPEVADLCEGEDVVVEGGFSFPRVYSNSAAVASMVPCTPLRPGDVWSDVTAEPSQIQTIAAGGSIKFRLTGWSTGPLPDWKVRVRAASSSMLSQDEMRPELSSDMINNNVTVTLTLHAPLEAASGITGGIEVLSGANEHPWAVGFVVH